MIRMLIFYNVPTGQLINIKKNVDLSNWLNGSFLHISITVD